MAHIDPRWSKAYNNSKRRVSRGCRFIVSSAHFCASRSFRTFSLSSSPYYSRQRWCCGWFEFRYTSCQEQHANDLALQHITLNLCSTGSPSVRLAASDTQTQSSLGSESYLSGLLMGHWLLLPFESQTAVQVLREDSMRPITTSVAAEAL